MSEKNMVQTSLGNAVCWHGMRKSQFAEANGLLSGNKLDIMFDDSTKQMAELLKSNPIRRISKPKTAYDRSVKRFLREIAVSYDAGNASQEEINDFIEKKKEATNKYIAELQRIGKEQSERDSVKQFPAQELKKAA